MPSDPPKVHVHADESCLGNQFADRDRPGGAAVLLEHWRDGRWARRDAWASDPSTTNNRMAITSGILALEALKEPSHVHFVSDSQYLVKGASEWLPGWKRRGWKRRTGVIENVDLWRILDGLLLRHRVEWAWIRGHAGHARNEYVNDLAVRAATELSTSRSPVASGFETWLAAQRNRGRYLDFDEFAPL